MTSRRNFNSSLLRLPLNVELIATKRKFLYDPTKERDWPLQISSSTHFTKLSYEHLIHELENSLQQHAIHKSYKTGNSDNLSYCKSRIAETNFNGRGKYQYPRKKNPVFKSSYITSCWNFGQKNCAVNKCPYPTNARKSHKSILKYFQAKRNGCSNREVTEALFEISQEYINNDKSNDENLSEDSVIEENAEEESAV